MRQTTFFFAAFMVVALVAAHAQPLSRSARSVGMANSGTSLVTGVDAFGVNPANLAAPSGSLVSIGLLPLGVVGGTDFLDFGTYQKYFTGVDDGTGNFQQYYLTESDKTFLLDQFAGNTGNLTLDVGFKLLAVNVNSPVGAFGFYLGDRVAANLTLSKDYADFLLNGNTPGRTFDFSETQFASSWTREYGLSYAVSITPVRRVLSLQFGATAKLVQGFAYFGTERLRSTFTTDANTYAITGTSDMRANYAGTEFFTRTINPFAFNPFPRPVGTGFGLDLGVSTTYLSFLTIGASITDIGSINWNRSARTIVAESNFLIDNVANDNQVSSLWDELNGDDVAVDAFRSPLPTAFHFGASVDFRNFYFYRAPLALAMAVHKGFNNEPGNSENWRIGLGGEWEGLDGFPLRTGIMLGGYQPVMFAFGIGIRIERFTLDIATDNISSVFSNNFSTASLSLGSRLDF
ncbi:MAG: conjugal transfer protein TraF [Chlorobi bacterium]|nr:conjugal transfer protein TraF [Chlorobiota bacterium]